MEGYWSSTSSTNTIEIIVDPYRHTLDTLCARYGSQAADLKIYIQKLYKLPDSDICSRIVSKTRDEVVAGFYYNQWDHMAKIIKFMDSLVEIWNAEKILSSTEQNSGISLRF